MRIIRDGDIQIANRYVPLAKKALAAMKHLMSLSSIPIDQKIEFLNYKDAKGYVKSAFGQDTIRLIGTGSVGEVILYLATIGVPVFNDELGILIPTDYDADGLELIKIYAYHIGENIQTGEGILTKVIFNSPYEFKMGEGLNLVLQEGYIPERLEPDPMGIFPDTVIPASWHYGHLPHKFINEEEIGMINWKAQQLLGTGLPEDAIPDEHIWWGKGFVTYLKNAILGSDKAIQKPPAKSRLESSSSARKDYVVNADGIVTHINLFIVSETILKIFSAPAFGVDYGAGVFAGILEYANPFQYKTRYVNKFKIKSTNLLTGQSEDFYIAEDVHVERVTGDDEDNYNWTYFVPIVAVTNKKAFMRKVQRTATGKTCHSATLAEELRLGDEVLTSISKTGTVQISNMTITNENAHIGLGILEGAYYPLDLNGCNLDDQYWELIEGSGVTIPDSRYGTLVMTTSVVEPIVVQATCISCGATAVWHSCEPESISIIGSDTIISGPGETYTISPSDIYPGLNIRAANDRSNIYSANIESTGNGNEFILHAGGACGSIEIYGSYCGVPFSKVIRVADGGSWVGISDNVAPDIDSCGHTPLSSSYKRCCAQRIEGDKKYFTVTWYWVDRLDGFSSPYCYHDCPSASGLQDYGGTEYVSDSGWGCYAAETCEDPYNCHERIMANFVYEWGCM